MKRITSCSNVECDGVGQCFLCKDGFVIFIFMFLKR